ncbi:hypothetical protein, partial [Aeromonas bivalvium]|uniref:hypothetical protein n=1 Tax=Aeromonas bivalvium TaxID=440079 RepID=UPI0038CFD0D7
SGAVAQPTTSEMSRIQAACQGIRRVPSGGIGECRTSKLNSRLTQGKPLSIYETNVDLHEIVYAECVLKSDRDILSNFNCISFSLKSGKIYNENEFYTGGSISSYFSDAGISYNYYYCVNKVRFPRGLLVSIYAPIKNFSSKLWSFGGKAPALCMIPYPNGLSTWCRFFDSEEI